jgi:hypothetical protein
MFASTAFSFLFFSFFFNSIPVGLRLGWVMRKPGFD